MHGKGDDLREKQYSEVVLCVQVRLDPTNIATIGLTPFNKQSSEFWLSLRADNSSSSEGERISLYRVMVKKTMLEFTLIFFFF